jgi:chaperone LolA
MKRLIYLFIFVFMASALADTGVEKIIKNVQKKYKNVKTIYVNFKQINTFKLTGIENEISGSLWLAQDNKFRLETEDQTIVSDGETSWRYNKMDNQVLIDYAKKGEQQIFLNNFLFKIADLYYSQIVSEEKDGKDKIYVIKLTPKNADNSFFNYIKVWIVDKSWDLKRVTYVDYNDNESEYQIEKLDLNPSVNKDIFVFTAPEGADVVDLRL